MEHADGVIHIARHEIDPDMAKSLPHLERMVATRLDKVRRIEGGLAKLGTYAFNLAGCLASFPDPPGRRRHLHETLRLAAFAWAGLFERAMRPAGEGVVEVDLGDGRLLPYPPTGPNGSANGQAWALAFFAAAICREHDLCDRLAAVPEDVLRQGNAGFNEYVWRLAVAIQAVWRGNPAPETLDRLRGAAAAATPEQLDEPEDPTLLAVVTLQAAPVVPLLNALYKNDAAKFRAALAQALQRHQEFAALDGGANDPGLVLPLAPLGAAALAHDAGLPVGVDSEYLPLFLVTGELRPVGVRAGG